jgi:small-conductance mechanosensitive channel
MWQELLSFTFFGIILYAFSILVNRTMNYLKKKDRIAPYMANSIQLIIRLFVIIILFIAFFSFVPLELNQILSISSITGLIVGFASTEVLIQVLSGIYIFTTRPFKVNELVQIDTTTGIVLDIGINFTILQQFDGSRVKIPNKKVWFKTALVNYRGRSVHRLSVRDFNARSSINYFLL